MAKAKTVAAAEEQLPAVETAEPAEMPKEGIDMDDTPLGAVDGKLAAVKSEIGLNLRKGPATGFPVAEVLEDGTVVKVLQLPEGAEVPGWLLIHTGFGTGWVMAQYVVVLEQAEEV